MPGDHFLYTSRLSRILVNLYANIVIPIPPRKAGIKSTKPDNSQVVKPNIHTPINTR